MNNNNFDKIIDAASKSSGVDKNLVKKAVQNGDLNNILNRLKPEEINKIKGIMNDKSALEKILNSKQAQNIIKNLSEGT